MITIQSVDVGTCLDEGVHHCGRALEVDSKVQGGQLGGNSGEQKQIKNLNFIENKFIFRT